MKSRERIYQQQSKNVYVVLAWVLAVVVFIVLGAIFESWGLIWITIILLSIGFGIATYKTTPRCPFCRTTQLVQTRKIGNYCIECGNSFDKPEPIEK